MKKTTAEVETRKVKDPVCTSAALRVALPGYPPSLSPALRLSLILLPQHQKIYIFIFTVKINIEIDK